MQECQLVNRTVTEYWGVCCSFCLSQWTASGVLVVSLFYPPSVLSSLLECVGLYCPALTDKQLFFGPHEEYRRDWPFRSWTSSKLFCQLSKLSNTDRAHLKMPSEWEFHLKCRWPRCSWKYMSEAEYLTQSSKPETWIVYCFCLRVWMG